MILNSALAGQAAARPFFKSAPPTRTELNKAYVYHVDAADSSGATVNISAPLLPGWVQYDASSHTLTGIANASGQFLVHLVASSSNAHVDQYYMITVFDRDTKNILFLGNSITNGTDKFNSYRRPLWKLLHRENYDFDFIGSWDKHHMGGDVPDPDFDMDHEGHSGWTANHIFQPPDWDIQRGNINSWLTRYTPDIVVVELGTNDVFQCRTPEEFIHNTDALVKLLRTKNPDVRIIISLVMPLGKKWSDQNLCHTQKYGEIILKLNTAIKTFAPQASTTRSAITIVDINSGIRPDKNMYDDIHPNISGEAFLAEKYYDVLKQYLTRLK